MTIMWIAIGLATLVAVTLWWRERNQAEAVKQRTPSKPRGNLLAVAALCGIIGVAGWVFYAWCFAGRYGDDWMVYHTVARAVVHGNFALIYDGVRLTAEINARFSGWLAHPLPLHPWLYPPQALFLLAPFGLLPAGAAGVLFVGGSIAWAIAAAWRFARNTEERAVYVGSLLLCPASAFTICVGQNTFLTCALLLSGFAALPRRPALAGALLGLLAYKPQLCLLVPVALLAARQWKALAAATGTVALLALLSVALFGIGIWQSWIALMTAPSALYEQWRVIAQLNGQSVYTDAILLGASSFVANLAQAAAALLAAGAVWWSYRRPMADALRVAVLLAATTLAAPHIMDYDAVLLGLAATLFFVHARAEGLHFGETALAVLVWTSPLMSPPSALRVGLVTPLLVALFVLWVMARGLAPALRTASGRKQYALLEAKIV